MPLLAAGRWALALVFALAGWVVVSFALYAAARTWARTMAPSQRHVAGATRR
jgi:hypothetical protein